MTADEALATIERACRAIGNLQADQKRLAMVYDRDRKERAAIANGLPANSYYDLAYADWEPIRNEYERKLTEARRCKPAS